MIHKLRSSIPGHVRVVFELPACVWADRIYLSGDFNNWSRTELPLHQDRDGVWRAALDLPAGRRYQFRYLVDGQWRTDYHADGYAPNEYGSQNSILLAETPDTELQATPALAGSNIHENRTGGHRTARFPRPRPPSAAPQPYPG